MTIADGRRLADIRAQLSMWAVQMDTTEWEAAFFLRLLEEKDSEIKRLKADLHQLPEQPTRPEISDLDVSYMNFSKDA